MECGFTLKRVRDMIRAYTQNGYIEKTKIVTCWQLFLKQNKCVSSLRNSEKRILTNEFEQGSREKTSLEGN